MQPCGGRLSSSASSGARRSVGRVTPLSSEHELVLGARRMGAVGVEERGAAAPARAGPRRGAATADHPRCDTLRPSGGEARGAARRSTSAGTRTQQQQQREEDRAREEQPRRSSAPWASVSARGLSAAAAARATRGSSLTGGAQARVGSAHRDDACTSGRDHLRGRSARPLRRASPASARSAAPRATALSGERRRRSRRGSRR